MDVDNSFSESESIDKQDEKDKDFKIEDYQDEINSDDSYTAEPEAKKADSKANENDEQEEEEQESEYVGPILPGGHRFDKKFVCIKYPGNVVNEDRAIETLGGIKNISKAMETHNRRLELRFRPDDVFCKPACGDKHKTCAFLLRVRVKKSRVNQVEEAEKKAAMTKKHREKPKINTEDEKAVNELADQVKQCSVGPDICLEPHLTHLSENSGKSVQDTSTADEHAMKNKAPTFERGKYEDLSKDEEYELPKLKVLGWIDTEYRFKNLCDFQYVPMTESQADPTKLECIYDKIYPSTLPPYSWLKNDVPYFLPPAAFSRMDNVQLYVPKTEVDSTPANVIGKSKKRKSGFLNYIYFSTPNVPTARPSGIETAMKVKFVQNVHLEQMRKLFDERPIWSKNAIMYETKFTSERLKILLPSVAYYFMNGPWKITWVRLGYDPRKDSSARKYQTLDYRLKSMHGLGSTVKCKRNYMNYTLPYKSAPTMKQHTTLLHASSAEPKAQKKSEHVTESVYIYRKGTLPPSRQMFYQYCDVRVDEIQDMLAKLPDPLPGTECHEKHGWLPSGFDVQCREIINKQVRAVLRKQMNIPDDHPTSLPRKRKRRRDINLKVNQAKNRIKKNEGTRKKRKKEDPVPSISTEHDDAIPGTSSMFDDAVPGTSSMFDDAVPGTSSMFDDAVPGTSMTDDDAVPSTSMIDDDAVSGTSMPDDDAVPGTSMIDDDAVSGTSMPDDDAVPGTSMIDDDAVSGTSMPDDDAVPGTSMIDDDAVPGTSMTDDDAIPSTSAMEDDAEPSTSWRED